MTPAAEDHYAERLRQLLHLPVTRLSVAGAQHGYQHLTATLADGRAVFAQTVPAQAVFLPPGRPAAKAAVGFGAGLARLHAAGADAFGAQGPGRIASLPLDNTPGQQWGPWYAEQRLVPYLRKASDSGALSRADAGLVAAVAARTGSWPGRVSRRAAFTATCGQVRAAARAALAA